MPINIVMSFRKIYLMFHLSKYVYHFSVMYNKKFRILFFYKEPVVGITKS